MRPARAFMHSPAARGALSLAVAAALVALPGCGSDKSGKPIPLDSARQMLALLGQADQQAGRGVCRGADAKVKQAQGVLDNLPKSVDKDVRQGLADGYDHLRSLIDAQCERPQNTNTETTDTTATTESETTPTVTETQTTPTNTDTNTATTTTPTTTGTTTQTTPTTTTGGNGGTPPPPGNVAGNDQ